MIFEVSRTFESLTTIESWAPYLPAIENLLNSHLSGSHYILPTRTVAEILLSFGHTFSVRQRAVLEYEVLAKLATLLSGARSSKFTIYLTGDGEAPSGLRANQRAMPLRALDDPAVSVQTRILVENSDRDGTFWKCIVITLARDANIIQVPDLHFEMGGGSSLADVYCQKIQRRNPTLCIVDSDQEYPGGPLGDTARRVRALKGTEPLPTIEAHILGVREIENFIPIKVLEDVYASNPQVQSRLAIFGRIEHVSRAPHCSPGSEYNRFMDMKDGLRRSVILRQQSNAGNFFGRLWKAALPAETEFDLEGDEEIFAGVSTNLLDETLRFLRRPANRTRMRARVRDLVFYPELMCMVRTILAFAAAPSRQRV
jgi:hypothetical protein